MDNFNYKERPRERKSVNEENAKSKDALTRIVILQILLSLFITAVLFFICQKDIPLSQNIKSFYAQISKNDISVSEVFQVIKGVAETTFAPIDDEVVSDSNED